MAHALFLMRQTPYLILLVALSCIASQAEEVFPRICWFDVPPKLERYTEINDPGDDPFSMRSKAITFQPAGVGQSDFRALSVCIRLVGASIGQGKVVSIKPISDEQLKSAMPAAVAPNSATNSLKVEETKLAGQRALKMHRATSPAMDIFWIRVRPNQVLEVQLIGASEALLASARPWLSALRVQVSDKPDPRPVLQLAKNRMQLGLTQAEMRERCGEPTEVAGPHETYVTDQYLVSIGYSDTVNYIDYIKVRDPQKAGTALNQQELSEQFLPMTKAEAQKLLQGLEAAGGLAWSPAGEDRWKRADGAMAGLHDKALTIATADLWPRIHFKSVQKQP
jgi:hypothetical protein